MVIVIMMMVIVIIMIASYTNVSHRHHDIRCGNRGQQQEQEQGYVMLDEHWMFLAVQNSSIGDLVCPLVGWSGTTNNQTLQSDPRDSLVESLHNTTE